MHILQYIPNEVEVIMAAKNNKDSYRLPINKTNVNNNDDENGFLKIRVTTGLGKFPLNGAKVTVYASPDQTPIQTVMTDENGYCPIITLPVSYNPEIREMDPVYYYTDYSFGVSFNNYYPTATYSVQAFPGITTEFDINMNPVPAIDPLTQRELQTEIPRINF